MIAQKNEKVKCYRGGVYIVNNPVPEMYFVLFFTAEYLN